MTKLNPSLWANLPLTREGFIWLLGAALLLVTGLLKGINLVTLLACAMFVVLLLNFVLSGRQLQDLRCRRFVVEPAFAGRPIQVVIEIINKGKRERVGVLVGSETIEHEDSWFVPRIGSRQTLTFQSSVPVEKRGAYRLGPLSLVCGFPLGLVYRERRLLDGQQVVVLPRVGELKRGLLRRLLSYASQTSDKARLLPRRHPTAQTEFYGLREFRNGDSTRWVHWRSSARRGQLVVCEFEEQPMDQLLLIFDPHIHGGTSTQGSEAFEAAVSLAATVCWEWCRQKGDPMAMGIASSTPLLLTGTTGDAFAVRCLKELAVIDRESEINYEDFERKLMHTVLVRGAILVITPDSNLLQERINGRLRRKVACINVAEEEFADYTDIQMA